MSARVINGALVWWMGPPGENNGIGPGYVCMLGQDCAYIEKAAWWLRFRCMPNCRIRVTTCSVPLFSPIDGLGKTDC